jgi:hypothetical protein
MRSDGAPPSASRRLAPWAILSLIGVVAVGSLCCVGVLGGGFDEQSTSPAITGPDGREYIVVSGWWSTGIGRVTHRTFGRSTIDVLVTAGTDSPRHYAALIRPADAPDAPLRFSPDGLVVADDGAHTYAAVAMDGSREFAGSKIYDLSPFVLLDATRKGRDADVDSIVRYLKPNAAALNGPDPVGDARSGVPSEESLLSALDSPNPWVRGAARRIVEAGSAKLYPEATKRLATSPR